jgi:diaminohydroxyphosphoribosylaminopyrimidine deaminase/5-amino-6-(5-phosphoribosylamino)uracil reductase
MEFSPADNEFMSRAIKLAERGLGLVSPNPPVGCVIVRDGKIIGEGWHREYGFAHAEPNALDSAGDARGATAYVTLMPCNHTGKTPPCTEALIAAGIGRVVVAVDDPNPASGDGKVRLEQAGIPVEVGCMGREAAYVMAGFLKHARTGLPLVRLKYAMTMDGKTATRTGDSCWISCEQSREEVQRMRSMHDAVIVGSGTAVRDDPRLNVRDQNLPQPLRVIVDSSARIPPESKIFSVPGGRIIIITTADAPSDALARLESAGAEILQTESLSGHVNLLEALTMLAGMGVRTALCESGSTLSGALLKKNLVDEIHVFIAPKILGDNAAPGGANGFSTMEMKDSLELTDMQSSRCGTDAHLIAKVGDWSRIYPH